MAYGAYSVVLLKGHHAQVTASNLVPHGVLHDVAWVCA